MTASPRPIQLRWVAASAAAVLGLGSLIAPAIAAPEPAQQPIAAGAVDDFDRAAYLVDRDLEREPADLAADTPPAVAPTAPATAEVPEIDPADLTPSRLTASGIPSVALKAYKRTAKRMAAVDPGCKIRWELIAAIGRVESNHGRFGGSVMTRSGEALPHILGPVLDGAGPVALIRDTDDGRMDSDTTYDRAVGPMQFLPGTWKNISRDGDRDGERNVHDIDDAAMATGAYLCAGKGDLSKPKDLAANIFRYNHSDAYVALVTKVMQAYGATPPRIVPPGVAPAATAPAPIAAPAPVASPKPTASSSPKPAATADPSPSPTVSEPEPTPTPSPSEPDPTAEPSPTDAPAEESPTP